MGVGGAGSGGRTDAGPPITTRQLESLVRLAEARARLELREEVTARDAQDVVLLMRETLWALSADDLGHLDLRNPTAGRAGSNNSAASRTRLAKQFFTVLSKKSAAEPARRRRFSRQEIFNLFTEHGGNASDFTPLIETLNFQGFVLLKDSKYELVNESMF